MPKPMSYEEWYDKFEDEIVDAEYEAFMGSGAYYDTDREAFGIKFCEDAYDKYCISHAEAVEDAGLFDY